VNDEKAASVTPTGRSSSRIARRVARGSAWLRTSVISRRANKTAGRSLGRTCKVLNQRAGQSARSSIRHAQEMRVKKNT